MIRLALIAGIVSLTALAAACGQGDQATRKTGDKATEIVADDFRYTGAVSLVGVAPTRLQASVSLTNATDRPLRLEYGACAVVLLGFDNPARSGTPVWDSEERRDPVTGNPYACYDTLYIREVGPGESLPAEELQMLVPLYEIVGHSLLGRFLPDGRYYWLARVQVNDQTIEVPLGQLLLKMDEQPLPRQRSIGGLLYRVDTWTAATSPTAVGSTLSVVNQTDALLTASIADRCPFSLYAYREKARRDAAFVAGEPDWRPEERCLLEMVFLRLDAGESRQISITVPGAEILGDSLPEGRYYLAAVVRLRNTSIWLAAGDIQIQR